MASWKLAFLLATVASLSAVSITDKMQNLANGFLSSASISTLSGCENVCSGVILNSRWIIITLHSIRSYKDSQLWVNYGSRNQNVRTKFGEVKHIVKNESNNLALIEIQYAITFNSNVQPAKWPKTELENCKWVYAIGWKVCIFY